MDWLLVRSGGYSRTLSLNPEGEIFLGGDRSNHRGGFLAKYSADGMKIWQRRVRGRPWDSAVAPGGSVIVPSTWKYQFLLKYSKMGRVRWRIRSAAPNQISGRNLVVHPSGKISLLDISYSPHRRRVFTELRNFTVKGKERWKRRLPNAKRYRYTQIAVGPSESTYVLTGPRENVLEVRRYSSGGHMMWSTTLEGYTRALSMAVDSDGYAYTYVQGVETPLPQLLVKISPAGEIVWAVDQFPRYSFTHVLVGKSGELFFVSGDRPNAKGLHFARVSPHTGLVVSESEFVNPLSLDDPDPRDILIVKDAALGVDGSVCVLGTVNDVSFLGKFKETVLP